MAGVRACAALALAAAVSWAGMARAQAEGESPVTTDHPPGTDGVPATGLHGLLEGDLARRTFRLTPPARRPDRVPPPAVLDRDLPSPLSPAGSPLSVTGAGGHGGEAGGYSPQEITDPIPLHSSLSLQPTYQDSSEGGAGKGYLKLKAAFVVEARVPLFSRIEWRAPEIDSGSGPTTVGVGDLEWLNLFLAGGTAPWGKLGVGPVFVFPTASLAEMGHGKYQVGPALGYVNDAVAGWQFALLAQQFFSFAGDASRSAVNQLSIQPFAVKHLSDSWYLKSQPVITVNFEDGTSRLPLALAVGKAIAGRWDLSVEVIGYPRWTAPVTSNFSIVFSIGYHFSPLFSRR